MFQYLGQRGLTVRRSIDVTCWVIGHFHWKITSLYHHRERVFFVSYQIVFLFPWNIENPSLDWSEWKLDWRIKDSKDCSCKIGWIVVLSFNISNWIFFFQHKRAAEAIRGPYNANRHSRYVELVLVIDKKEYIALDENVDKVYQHCKDIANIINAVSTAFFNIWISSTNRWTLSGDSIDLR